LNVGRGGRTGGVGGVDEPRRRASTQLAESGFHHSNPFVEAQPSGPRGARNTRPVCLELVDTTGGILDRAHAVGETGHRLDLGRPTGEPARADELPVKLHGFLDDLSRQVDNGVALGRQLALRPPASRGLRPRVFDGPGQPARRAQAAVQGGGHAGAPKPGDRRRRRRAPGAHPVGSAQ
jgi:hypothetical protein